MKPKIVAHCLVKNEERFIWYALKSVLPYVDEIMVWDTGSTDQTVEIILSLGQSDLGQKIKFKQLEAVDATSHTQVRQQMLDATDKKSFTWLMILDGDEVWGDHFAPIYQAMGNPQTNTIAVHTINFVGDIYHKLPESAGQYQIAGHRGHLNLRFIRLDLPDLKVINPHGGQTYTSLGVALQNQTPPAIQVLPTSYFHASHLVRSRHDRQTLKRFFKRKHELGIPLTRQQLPPVFFEMHPLDVPDVTAGRSAWELVVSLIQTPLRIIRRRLFSLPTGYIHKK